MTVIPTICQKWYVNKGPMKMIEHKLFLQRIGLIGIVQLLTSLNSIILLPILTKNLSIEEYGLWAQITVTISIFPGLVMLGLPYSMVRFLPVLKKKVDIQEAFYSIFLLVTLTSGITSLLFYILSKTIASILFDNNIFVVKVLSLILFVECSIALFMNYLRARQNIKKYSLCISIKIIFSVIVVSFLVLVKKEINAAVIGILITDLMTFIIVFYLVISEIGIKKPSFKQIKEYLDFGLPTVPGNFSNWIISSSDRYLIGIFLGTASVGYYSPGYAIGNLIGMFFTPLSFLLTAALSKSYDENNLEEVKTFLSYSFKYLLVIAIPATFGISFMSKYILTILSTPEIASQGYFITPFTALSSLLSGIYGIIAEILALEKRTEVSGKIWTIAAILNFGLNLVFIPSFGIVGAAITTLIAFVISLILIIYYSSNSLKFDLNLKFISKSIVSSILMSFMIYFIKPEGLIHVLLTVGICTLAYFMFLYLLNGFDKNELKSIYSIIKH